LPSTDVRRIQLGQLADTTPIRACDPQSTHHSFALRSFFSPRTINAARRKVSLEAQAPRHTIVSVTFWTSQEKGEKVAHAGTVRHGLRWLNFFRRTGFAGSMQMARWSTERSSYALPCDSLFPFVSVLVPLHGEPGPTAWRDPLPTHTPSSHLNLRASVSPRPLPESETSERPSKVVLP